MNTAQLEQIYAQITSQKLPKREEYISRVSTQIQKSVSWDVLIVQAVRSIEDADVAINMVAKRMREWYEWENPEHSRSIDGHEGLAKSIVELAEKNQELPQTIMGAKLSEQQHQAIVDQAKLIAQMAQTRENTKAYIESEMQKFAPKFTELAGAVVGAKLISCAGTMRHLATLPASTIQLLGAEKALFRHLKTGARPPKYGILYQHPDVSKSAQKGKTARQLANKLAIAAKQDYFGVSQKSEGEEQ